MPHSSISPDLSRKLGAVSLLAAFGVVLLHSCPTEMEKLEPTLETFLCTCLEQSTSFAVPMFFAVSGYLFAVKTDLGCQPHWYSTTLKKRVKSLLVPYLIWCTINAVSFVPFKMYGNHLAGRNLTSGLPMPKRPLLSIWNICGIYGITRRHPGCPILWFIRSLMFMILISPLYFSLFKKRITAILLLAFAFTMLVIEWKIPTFLTYPGFSFFEVFYFMLGIFFAFYPISRDSFPLIRRILPLLWIIVNLVTTVYFWLGLLKMSFHILSVLNSLLGMGSIWVLTDSIRPLSQLGNRRIAQDTFFLYMFHYLVLAFFFCNTVEKVFLYRLHIPVTVIFFSRFVVAAFSSLMAAEWMKKHLPKTYRILTGGR